MRRSKRTILGIATSAVLWGQAPRAQLLVFGESTVFRRGPILYLQDGDQVYRTDDQPEDQRSWGLRATLGLDEDCRWNLEVAVRAKKQSRFTYVGLVSPIYFNDFRGNRLEYSWWGPGLSYGLRLAPTLRLHLGLDYRIERLTVFSEARDTESTLYTRPWVRGGLAVEWPRREGARPVLGVEYGWALVREAVSDGVASPYPNREDLRRRLAPNASMDVFLGLRF